MLSLQSAEDRLEAFSSVVVLFDSIFLISSIGPGPLSCQPAHFRWNMRVCGLTEILVHKLFRGDIPDIECGDDLGQRSLDQIDTRWLS